MIFFASLMTSTNSSEYGRNLTRKAFIEMNLVEIIPADISEKAARIKLLAF
jgi:hypothetical protein